MCAVGIVCVVDWLEPVHFMGCVQGHLVSVVLVFCFAAAGGCCAYFAHVHILLFSLLLLQQFGFKYHFHYLNCRPINLLLVGCSHYNYCFMVY